MTRKIYLIIIGILILLVVVILSIYKIPVKNLPNQQYQSGNQNIATLPAGSSTNPQNIQSVQKEIENVAQEPISEKTIKSGSKFVDFVDGNNNPIPLNDFIKATNIKINQNLQNSLDNKDYTVFYCPESGEKKDFGVYFGYDVGKAYAGLYRDTLTWMKNWEKTMFPDLHTVLYPGLNFSNIDLGQNMPFKDGKYRYADVRLPNGQVSSINYYVSRNGVIITTSPSCMDKMVDIYEPTQP